MNPPLFLISMIEEININGIKKEKSKTWTTFVNKLSFMRLLGTVLVRIAGRPSESHKEAN